MSEVFSMWFIFIIKDCIAFYNIAVWIFLQYNKDTMIITIMQCVQQNCTRVITFPEHNNTSEFFHQNNSISIRTAPILCHEKYSWRNWFGVRQFPFEHLWVDNYVHLRFSFCIKSEGIYIYLGSSPQIDYINSDACFLLTLGCVNLWDSFDVFRLQRRR